MAEGGGAGGSLAERGEEIEEVKGRAEIGEEAGGVLVGRTWGITSRGRAERSEEALERDVPPIEVAIGTSRTTIVFSFSVSGNTPINVEAELQVSVYLGTFEISLCYL